MAGAAVWKHGRKHGEDTGRRAHLSRGQGSSGNRHKGQRDGVAVEAELWVDSLRGALAAAATTTLGRDRKDGRRVVLRAAKEGRQLSAGGACITPLAGGCAHRRAVQFSDKEKSGSPTIDRHFI